MRVAPYGSWSSTFTAALAASESTRIEQPWVDGHDLYWIERRPREGGRNAIVRLDRTGAVSDAIPSGWSAQNWTMDYGGADYTVSNGIIFFSAGQDQRIHRCRAGQAPVPVTPPGGYRYADLQVDPRRGNLVCVRENHEVAGEPQTELVIIDRRGDTVTLHRGHDFYAAPRLHPSGDRLAFMTWDHPDMPWDSAEIWVAELDRRGLITATRRVAGGGGQAACHPAWSPEGELHFVNDPDGWWNLYRWHPDSGRATNLLPAQVEFGLPLWRFGYQPYAFLPGGRIACGVTENGIMRLILLEGGRGRRINLPYADLGRSFAVRHGRLVAACSWPFEPTSLVEFDLDSGARTLLRQSSPMPVDERYLAFPVQIEFTSGAGRTAFAHHYRPKNPAFQAPAGEKPPLVISVHGGPVAWAGIDFAPELQFFVNHGFAVVDVDYGGSTGYGREYRQRLYGAWGQVDVEDCLNAARHLVARGEADPERIVIRGGSAGGYTTLSALCGGDPDGLLRAGASYYGICDLLLLDQTSTKFESRSTARLIGLDPDLAGQDHPRYRERSPIHHLDQLRVPLLVLQGSQDEVVPPSQAELLVGSLRARGVDTEYLLFEGEGHGFRAAASIRRALEAELAFYRRVLGISDPP